MAGKLFQVWVPASLVAIEGKRVLTERYEDPEAGMAWQVREKTRLRLKALAMKRGRQTERLIGPEPKSITLTAAMGLWIGDSSARKSTQDYYDLLWRAHLEPKLGDLKLAAITRARVRQHLAEMEDAGKSQETRRRVLMVLRAILDDARGRGYQVDGTVWKLEIRKAPRQRSRRYDPDLVEQLIAKAEGQDKTMLQVAAWTGLRLAELVAFEPSWIRWREGRIAVPSERAFQTKSGRERSVPLFPELEALLRKHLGDRTSGRVFRPVGHGSDGKAWTKDGMISAFDRLAKEAALDAVFSGWHDLRHHYASDLANKGASAPDLMQVMGWRDLATAMKYLHASPNHLASLRSKLSPSSESSSRGAGDTKSGPRAKGPKPASNQ